MKHILYSTGNELEEFFSEAEFLPYSMKSKSANKHKLLTTLHIITIELLLIRVL